MILAERLYALLRTVPEGKVTTYKDLAAALGTTGYRAVGQLLRRNPDAPRTPCHRVVASDGAIGGFNGARTGDDIKRKTALLAGEGVAVRDGRVQRFDEVRHRWG